MSPTALRSRRVGASALVTAVALFGTPSKAAAQMWPELTAELDSVREALDQYRDPLAAIHDGYLSTLACMDFPAPGLAGATPFPAGAMGVHLLNPALIGAPLDRKRPQALIYEPHGDTLRLVAAEWFVPVQVMRERPTLFGKAFDGPMDGHHPIMPESLRHWDLHVWLWRQNPAGLYASTNPAVRCPPGVYTVWMMGGH